MQQSGGLLLAAGLDGGDSLISSPRGRNAASPCAPAKIGNLLESSKFPIFCCSKSSGFDFQHLAKKPLSLRSRQKGDVFRNSLYFCCTNPIALIIAVKPNTDADTYLIAPSSLNTDATDTAFPASFRAPIADKLLLWYNTKRCYVYEFDSMPRMW